MPVAEQDLAVFFLVRLQQQTIQIVQCCFFYLVSKFYEGLYSWTPTAAFSYNIHVLPFFCDFLREGVKNIIF